MNNEAFEIALENAMSVIRDPETLERFSHWFGMGWQAAEDHMQEKLAHAATLDGFAEAFDAFWNWHHTKPPHDHHEYDCCQSGARWMRGVMQEKLPGCEHPRACLIPDALDYYRETKKGPTECSWCADKAKQRQKFVEELKALESKWNYVVCAPEFETKVRGSYSVCRQELAALRKRREEGE